MSFQDDYKISNADRADKGVFGLPDTPGLSTMALQTRFDSLGNLAIDKFNNLVDAVEETVTDDPKLVTGAAVVAYTRHEVDSVIDDENASYKTTYSSNKINELIDGVPDSIIDDDHSSYNTTYSSNKINDLIDNLPIIDDDHSSRETTYSSDKINDLIDAIPVTIIDDSAPSLVTAYSGSKVEELVADQNENVCWIQNVAGYNITVGARTKVAELTWNQATDYMGLGLMFDGSGNLSANANITIEMTVDDSQTYIQTYIERKNAGAVSFPANSGFTVAGKGAHTAKVYMTVTNV